ncbi:MAG: tetratricopeptide repeat protein [Armatimonadota bacterium]
MENIKTQKTEALKLIKSGAYDEAIDFLQQVIAQDADDPDYHTFLGVAYCRKGDKLHSIAAFEESLRLDESPKAYYNLGLIYEEANRIEEAVRQYRMALEINPDYAPALKAMEKFMKKDEPVEEGETEQETEKTSA